MNLLYYKDSTIGRLLAIFASFFPTATKPTRYLLTWFLLGQLALKSAPSVRYLYRQFLSGQTDKALTSYYHALANERITNTSIRQALAEKALRLIPQALRNEPVFLSIDDTTISKFGKHFDDVSILYDHANHEKPYTNGHCFVSLTISVPVLTKTNAKTQIRYLAIPLGYALWDKSATKLELAAMLLDEVMPALEKRQVILLFDSWYAKRSLIAHALVYKNLEIVCNARCDTAIYEMPNSTAGRRGRPPKYGKKLTLAELSDGTKYYRYRMDKLFVTHQQVKTRIFGNRSVHAYVTTSQSGSRRLFFSTLNSMSMHMSIAWQENKALNGANSKEMDSIPCASTSSAGALRRTTTSKRCFGTSVNIWFASVSVLNI